MHWYQVANGTNAYRAISPTLSILDTHTGATVRTLTLGGQVPYAMVVDTVTSRLFVATGPMPPNTPGEGGNVRVLDTRTGALVRTVPLHTIPPFTPGALAMDETAGRVFVALTDFTSQSALGTLWVLDATTGAVVRAVAAGRGAATLAVDAPAHHLFVMSRGGDPVVRVLDTRTGAFVRSLTVGSGFGLLAVDERRGHLFFFADGTPAKGQQAANSAVRMPDTRSGAVRAPCVWGWPPPSSSTRWPVVPLSPTGWATWTARAWSTRPSQSACWTQAVAPCCAPSLWERLPVKGSMAVDEQAGRAFVVRMTTNSVSVLDTHTGAVLRTVALRPAPPRLGQ